MNTPVADGELLERIERGLRMVTVPFPHLAGLVAAARVTLDDRLPTIGVFASGRLTANPQFVHGLKDNELVFVLAHEMLHLALRTHDRAKGSDRLEFNYRARLHHQRHPAHGTRHAGAGERPRHARRAREVRGGDRPRHAAQ